MNFGDYRVEIIPDAEFKLDGGAMFGVVPRVVWERVCPADELNRIRMNMNCLFIETPDERILVETGIGEKWAERETAMYGIERQRPFSDSLQRIAGCRPEDISIVINTHLHFDHAGGNTVLSDGQAALSSQTPVTWCRGPSSNTPKTLTNATVRVICRTTGARCRRAASLS
jgi:glyoxylase-like metal-dependent hydrolase (beta-lactamase superfamily II)